LSNRNHTIDRPEVWSKPFQYEDHQT
jgi:hypothetical protein